MEKQLLPNAGLSLVASLPLPAERIRQISKEPGGGGASRVSWEASLMSETRGIGPQPGESCHDLG